MIPSSAFDSVPLWLILVATIGLVAAAVEAGFRLGRYRRRHSPEREAPVGAMVGAILGLLAFLLAFTFSLAASRFDERRRTIVAESNAVGTTFLRAGLLAEPHRSAAQAALRDYVDARIAAVQQGTIVESIERSTELHKVLWSQATAVSEQDPRSIPVGLFVQSLNDMIDMHSTRVMVGLRSRIPVSIWGALYLLATLTMVTMGYHEGLASDRRSAASFALILAFAMVMVLIVDLDRPREGLLQISQASMIELRESMEK